MTVLADSLSHKQMELAGSFLTVNIRSALRLSSLGGCPSQQGYKLMYPFSVAVSAVKP